MMPDEHVQLSSLRRALADLEGLRNAALSNGERQLAAYLSAAVEAVERAVLEVGARVYAEPNRKP